MLGIVVPVIVLMQIISLVHYVRERRLFDRQIQMTTSLVGDVVLGSLRHAMMVNDQDMIKMLLSNISNTWTIKQVQIIDIVGIVKASSNPEQDGHTWQLNESGCVECHIFPPETRPRAIRLVTTERVMRISAPIKNETECKSCHSSDNAHLGVLLVDASMVNIDHHLTHDMRIYLGISIVSTLLIAVVVYWLMQSLVVRRIGAMSELMGKYANGNFAIRLPFTAAGRDELTNLTGTFNAMADSLDQHRRQQEELTNLRMRAIVEERERIARELHDGLSQVLGYVHTKAMAVRLLIHKRRLPAAETQLLQLEEAAESLFVDVRESILGLKMAGQIEGGLAEMLKEYTQQFSRLSDLLVQLEIAPEAEKSFLKPETELQLLRITQEALSNVRKHACAHCVWVKLSVDKDALGLIIGDDGIGFLSTENRKDQTGHFGLENMRERAEAIGAQLTIQTEPGTGTLVTIRLPLKEG
jgi:signal transduction histidine kinase